MIYTLTLNPAVDMSIKSNGLNPKIVNRVFDDIYTPNGKGINVSKVLLHFNIPSVILGFFGGFTGEFIVDKCKQTGLEILPLWVDGTTRISVCLNDGESEYKLLPRGPVVHETKQAKMLELIESLTDMDTIIISGSLPRGIEESYYVKLLEILSRKNVKTILDITAKNFDSLLLYKPFLIKPNDEEIKEMLGVTVTDDESALSVMSLLHLKGAQNVLLTLGENGAYFSNGKDAYYSSAKKVKLLSSVCAGDSALAAFLSEYLKNNKNIETAMKLSAATGANVAESAGIGPLDKIDCYKQEINIKKIK